MMVTDAQIDLIDERLNGQGLVIVTEAKRAGLKLPYACMLIQRESGGLNIFGCNYGPYYGLSPDEKQEAEVYPDYQPKDEPPYCHHEVTRERLDKALASEFKFDMGITQLSYRPLIEKAEEYGGAHIPRYQARVGFEVLKAYMDRYPVREAIASYNIGPIDGDNTPEEIEKGLSYADTSLDIVKTWRDLLKEE